MFTQCPHCQQQYPVSAEQLRQQRGLWQCSICTSTFDALELISDSSETQLNSDVESSDFLSNKPKSPQNQLFTIASMGAILILMAQISYFELSRFVQNPKTRAILQSTCQIFNCQLPIYRHLAEIKIAHSHFQAQANQHYHLQFTLMNESAYPQDFPQIKLTLQNFKGKSFASRVFPVNSYLTVQQLLKPDDLIAASLTIAQPNQAIGGYRLELL